MPAPRTDAAPEAARFRQVLGHFCTGVTVITTVWEGRPAGFACQAFAALSLDPPLVLFCPSRSSLTWPVIARAGHFCANVPPRPAAAVLPRPVRGRRPRTGPGRGGRHAAGLAAARRLEVIRTRPGG